MVSTRSSWRRRGTARVRWPGTCDAWAIRSEIAITRIMKLYFTAASPYARLARIVVVEKQLEGRVEFVLAQTRVPDSPYYAINPSGRVP